METVQEDLEGRKKKHCPYCEPPFNDWLDSVAKVDDDDGSNGEDDKSRLDFDGAATAVNDKVSAVGETVSSGVDVSDSRMYQH